MNFQQQKSFLNQYPECKSYQMSSIKSYLSRSFQQHQRHITIPPKCSATILIYFSVKKSFNIQELLHHNSKRHGTKPMHPSWSRASRRHQEHDLKHPPVRWISELQNKTNYLPPKIDSQIWLKYFLNDCHFDYITKSLNQTLNSLNRLLRDFI